MKLVVLKYSTMKSDVIPCESFEKALKFDNNSEIGLWQTQYQNKIVVK